MVINVALLSRWHVHADDYARDVQANENLNIKYVWDEDQARGEAWAKELNVPFESDLNQVLSNSDVDAVVVTTPTSMHKEIIIQAAEHGKHIFTEKVLAFTAKDCEAIYSAVEEANVSLMVSLPMLTQTNYLYAQKAIDEGWIGDLSMVRCRFAHSGGVPPQGQEYGWLPARFFDKADAGGGAMIDLGAHPIYLTNRLAGKAASVSASFMKRENQEVDNNSALLVEYESGALGIVETSFVSHGSPFQLEVYGTQGTLRISDGQVTVSSVHINDGKQTNLTEQLEALPMPMVQWVDEIKNGTQPTIKQADVVHLSLINEAAAKSAAEGTKVNVNDIN